jgi:hypothetical protein
MNKKEKIAGKTISIYFPEDILADVDEWRGKREKETGGKFARSDFVINAVLAKIKEDGLLDNEVAGNNDSYERAAASLPAGAAAIV